MKAKGDGILVHDLHGASGCYVSSRRVNGTVVRRFTPRPPKGFPPSQPEDVKWVHVDAEWRRLDEASRVALKQYAKSRGITPYLAYKRLFLTDPPPNPIGNTLVLSADRGMLMWVQSTNPSLYDKFAGTVVGYAPGDHID